MVELNPSVLNIITHLIITNSLMRQLLLLLCQFYNGKGASLVAYMVQNLPAMWETWVRSLGWEDPLEEEMATHSSLENPMDRGTWRATVHGIEKSWTQLSD